MKRNWTIVAIALTVSLFISTPVLADTIIEGNAESHTSVTTNIQGSGEVHTHIESTVNGKTKILDSDKPGTYTLDNSSDTTPKPTISSSTSAVATPTASVQIQQHDKTYIIHEITHTIRTFFHDTVQKLLSLFHL